MKKRESNMNEVGGLYREEAVRNTLLSGEDLIYLPSQHFRKLCQIKRDARSNGGILL